MFVSLSYFVRFYFTLLQWTSFRSLTRQLFYDWIFVKLIFEKQYLPERECYFLDTQNYTYFSTSQCASVLRSCCVGRFSRNNNVMLWQQTASLLPYFQSSRDVTSVRRSYTVRPSLHERVMILLCVIIRICRRPWEGRNYGPFSTACKRESPWKPSHKRRGDPTVVMEISFERGFRIFLLTVLKRLRYLCKYAPLVNTVRAVGRRKWTPYEKTRKQLRADEDKSAMAFSLIIAGRD